VRHYYGNRRVFDIKPHEETQTVTLCYREAPRFDDQVQGDLIRKYWAEGGTVRPIGIVPESPLIDPELDELEAKRRTGKPSPREIAQACYGALGKPEALTPDQFIGAIMTAVRKEREHTA
jgi:hypothetical protein